MSESTMAQLKEATCHLRGLMYKVEQGRMRGQSFARDQCLAVDKQMRRNLGELPEGLEGMSGAEQKAFYARLQTEFDCRKETICKDGKIVWLLQ